MEDDDCSKGDGLPTQKTKGSVRKDEFSGFAASFRRRKGRDRSLDAIGMSKVSERDSVSVIWPKELSTQDETSGEDICGALAQQQDSDLWILIWKEV